MTSDAKRTSSGSDILDALRDSRNDGFLNGAAAEEIERLRKLVSALKKSSRLEDVEEIERLREQRDKWHGLWKDACKQAGIENPE